MNKPVKILIVEDSEDDVKLALRALRRGGFDPAHRRVQTAVELETALVQERWDAVISDFNMPGFTGIDALRIFRSTGLDIPFILISGTIGEETAVTAMKAGASDYVMKQSLARLAPALVRELSETQLRAAHRQAQGDLVESERRFTNMLANLELISLMLDREARITYCNDYLLRLTGWQLDEVIGRNWCELFIPPEIDDLKDGFAALLANRPEAWHHENEILTRSGGRRLIRWNNSVLRSGAGDVIGTASIGEDITEHKEAADRIVYLNRVYAMLSGINTLIVHVRDRDELYREACRIAVEAGGFRMAMIAIVDQSTKKIVPVASAGKDAELLNDVKNRLSSNEAAPSTMVALAIREKQAVVSNDSQSDPRVLFSRKYADCGIRSMVILPLMVEDQAAGALALYAGESEFFHEEEMNLLTGLAGDIAFALNHIGKEEKIVRLSRIQAVMSGINAAIVHVGGRKELFNAACRIAVEHGHFAMAWIGTLDPASQDVTPIASAGESSELLTSAISSARSDSPRGAGAVGRAIRERRPVFNNDISAQTFGGPRAREVQRLGYRSQITLPLYEEQAIVATLTMYAREPNFFDEKEFSLLTELAGNISFALANIGNEEKIARLSRIQAVMSGINAALVHFHDRQTLFNDACRIAVEQGGFGIAWIGVLNPDTLEITPAAWAGVEAASLLASIQSSARADLPGGQGVIGRAIREKRVAFSNDLTADPGGGGRRKEAIRRGYHSTITLPLLMAGGAVGNLSLFARERNFFNADELTLLTDLAGNISFALDNIGRQQKLDKLARIQALSSEINLLIVRTRDRQNLFEAVCRIAVEYGGFGVAWIGMLDQNTLEIIPAACAGIEANSLAATSRNTARSDMSLGQGIVGRAIRERHPVFSNNLAVETSHGGARREEALRRGYHSLIALPLVVDDKAVGSLSLFAREPDFFTDEEIGLVSEVAGNVSFALDLIQKSEALADSEKKLDNILSTLREVVWSMDPQTGRILYINAAVSQLTQRPVNDFLAQPRLWRRMVHRADRAAVRRAIRRLLQVGTLDHEFRIVLADDGVRAVECSARVRHDDTGKAARIDGTISDITERKLAEETVKRDQALLRAVVDAIPERIYVKDRKGRILLENSTNLNAHGFGSLDAILGKTVFDLFPREIAERFHAEDEAVMASGAPLLNRERQTLFAEPWDANQQTRWHLASKVPLKDETGNVYGLVGVNRDITERKVAEAALHQLNEDLEGKILARTVDLQRARIEAEEANRAKSDFLATMSHEIRTPMNGVIGMIDVLHQSSLKGDQVEMVNLIRESAFSLLGIINDILDFSKIEAGKLDLEQEAFAVADVVEGVCSMLNGMAEKKDITLNLYTDPAIPVLVLGDALRLRQVLINLVNNAIKFSSGDLCAGRVSVRALLVEQSPQQMSVEFRVTDNGIGMDEETQARLFTAFSQADVTTTRRFGGTGLGLTIANHLVELMGGKITVHSAPGEGSVFNVRLSFVPLPAGSNAIEDDVTSKVAGLSCVVVGAAGGLADDLAVYLRHANALVERAPDLASARAQTAGRRGLSVWVVDASDAPQRLEQLRLVAHAQASQDICFVVVLIERGKRRRPRVAAPDMITVDGNALSRRTFLKAVAAAAGRASLEVEPGKIPSARLAAIAPSRIEALQQGRLILIAEDNETNQKVIVRQLALLGYTADIAADGLEALEHWHSGDYALLLTDLHMPKMDGYELTQAIRAEEKGLKRIPIIALTANALKGEADHCRAVGMDDYRSKPSPLSELKAVLDQWLPVTQSKMDTSAESGLPTPAASQATGVVPIDVSVLEGLVGDDPELVHEFLRDFRTSAARIALELRAACAAGLMVPAVGAAHKLKSSARAVGALALGELCAAMEEEGRAGDSDALSVLLPRFEAELAMVEDYLDQRMADVPVDVISNITRRMQS